VPLTLLTLDAWDFIRLRDRECGECGRALAGRHRWTICFLLAVGVWNFVGAGVFGFLINLPIVSYFEVGTVLTPNHGHAALFGVFGMLALGVVVFGLRALASEAAWARAERLVRFGFWGLNVGLGLMIVLDLFPAGVLQLWDVIDVVRSDSRSWQPVHHVPVSAYFRTSGWAGPASASAWCAWAALAARWMFSTKCTYST
jgi:nitric oxide reductase subunit B